MNISEIESTALKHFCQLLINRPLKMEQQQNIMKDGKIWCSEWESLELCKYIIYGKPYYYKDPLPNRLKNSSVFPGKKTIEIKASALMNKFTDVKSLIIYLKAERTKFK